MDRGQKDTEALLKELEQRINQEYSKAIADIEDELTDYFQRFEKKDETWRRWVEEGTKTQKEYETWRTGQMAVGKRWEAQKTVIAEELAHTNEVAKAMVKGEAPQVFADNFNYATYQIEKDAHINTSFTLYNREAVTRLVKDDPDVLPPIGKKVSQQIAEGKAVKWNKQQLQSVMIQGILQGDSIPKLATRLATTVGDRDRKAAIRNARTMTTAAQNAGRVNAYKRAQDKGVELEQMWMAVMDNRTRHSHRWLDGEVRPVGEAFSNGCEYPADPKGDPAEIYNCRCTLRGVVKGLERRAYKYRDTSAVDGMSYDEWRNAKAKSNPITLQEEKGKNIKAAYIAKYKGDGSNFAKIDDSFFMVGDNEVRKFTKEQIINAVNSSEVGRDMMRYAEDRGLRFAIDNDRQIHDNRGLQEGKNITIWTDNIKNEMVASQTVIHEIAHERYNIGGDQHSEAICFAYEKMHKENRDYLTKDEWGYVKDLAQRAYPNIPWEKDGANYDGFNFIR